MPLSAVRDMPYDEFQGWMSYLDRRPVGWREDDRTYKLLRAWGTEAKPGELFPSLASVYDRADEDRPATIKGSAFFQKVVTARGGEKLS